MIKISLNVTKLDKSRFFKGKSGIYADLILVHKPDDYGNDGVVLESQTKDEREKGKKGQIVGNWRNLGRTSSHPGVV